jgi:predicted dinucleotide-utilizing enzyme
VSIGALAHEELWNNLQAAATRSKIIQPAGAVVGHRCAPGARIEGARRVRLVRDKHRWTAASDQSQDVKPVGHERPSLHREPAVRHRYLT